ncbi:hypothetical protein PHLGIDRAFT_82261 [Phlebiopsis gigantea 11061_1 CR5-6]|uniref:GDP/GTP exchange factor Sec2 N-terminal domain-containing protein n=1 Tax=Phlebiopsis gigantea (strain 11061_1 CR5-6) TaxID=745531 RepID=A0A0C3PVY2_PHLG1|nr:hypothetical protein PHLGIDRAFT_82261 [Phlebiopsis gigantea 11061_1 CR5-6]
MAPALDHVDDEMHELNQEADYLDQTVRVDTPGVNGHKSESRTPNGDPDAQAQVIDSLRSQIQDLFSQVTQLNTKLVRSYDRVSDLEDELHVTSDNLRNSTLKVSQLELERAQHLSALSTGLLVEKSHVTAELTRLMEKATEEAARAGEAESARNAIEKDLDDLSAGLFDQANTMVVEARLGRARSERKVEETEVALRGAEEIVGMLQTQLQTLQADKEASDKQLQDMQAFVGKGKWVDRPQLAGQASKIRLLCLHAPYLEYTQFIIHLRSIRPTSTQPPTMTSLLTQAFLARLLVEDSDPTVRLDLAPQLNWLTRRSVLAAIHSGHLNIEPMSTTTLLEELVPSLIPGNSHAHVSCALCGSVIIDSPASPSRSTFAPTRTGSAGKSWAPTTLLKTSLVQTITSASFGHSRPATPTTLASEPPAHVFIFRLEATSSSGLPLPMSTQQPNSPARPPTIYPLCASGWCLTRLRTTCSLWAFIRTNVVEKVWEEEPPLPPSTLNTSSTLSSNTDFLSSGSDKPSLQPKRSRMGIGALWGSMSRSLSGPGTKAESTQSDAQDPKTKEEPAKSGTNKPVPPVPPRRVPSAPRTLPPPPPRHPPLAAPVPRPAPMAPPPLPKRNVQRTASPAVHDVPAPATPEPRSSEEDLAPLATPPEEYDSFTTPTEEIADPTPRRPMSPSIVPLPPSVPSTPVPATAPERSGSPAPARAATPQGDKPPIPPRGSAPPLPRRAAARARPVSLIPPEAPVVSEAVQSSDPAPLNTESTVDAPLTAHAPMAEEIAETIEEPAKEPDVDGEKEEPKPLVPAESISATAETESETAHDSRSETGERRDELKDLVDEKDDENMEPVHSSKEGSLRSLEDVSLVNGSVEMHDDEAQVINLTPDTASDVAEDDPGIYVGDSTWEERTWKELVKLREEMFWARIGGIR